jgi:hypothetical protein
VVCQAAFIELRVDTYASRGTFANPSDFKANYDRLTAAWPGLTAGITPPETYGALADFQASVTALGASPQLDPVVASRLADRAQGILDCVNANQPWM